MNSCSCMQLLLTAARMLVLVSVCKVDALMKTSWSFWTTQVCCLQHICFETFPWTLYCTSANYQTPLSNVEQPVKHERKPNLSRNSVLCGNVSKLQVAYKLRCITCYSHRQQLQLFFKLTLHRSNCSKMYKFFIVCANQRRPFPFIKIEVVNKSTEKDVSIFFFLKIHGKF